MKQDGSIQLFHYWNRLRNGRRAPKRTEIEPSDIKSLLADTFILEEDLRREAVFRLAGTRLCATYGRELKGFSFTSLWKEKDRRLIARLTYGVFAMKSVAIVSFVGVNRDERPIPFELMLLPLDGGVESSRCMGILSAGRRPLWLGVDPIREIRIEAVRVVDPDREPVFPMNRPAIPVPDLVPSDAAIGGTPRPGRRIRHLVVLDGGRS
jgi:hypothetical protein